MDRACTRGSEAARLRALDRYRLLDTPRDPDFDEIAQAAAELCEAPAAAVGLIGDGRLFLKAEIGLGVRETALSESCRDALLREDLLEIRDTARDPRLAGHPLVGGASGLRFYAGAMLRTPEGQPVGTVCVLDARPRDLGERRRRGLGRLARQAMAQMELRRLRREEEERRLRETDGAGLDAGAALAASELRYRSLLEVSPQVVWFGDAQGRVIDCNAYWYDYTGLPAAETGEASWLGAIHPDHREATRAAWRAASQTGRTYEAEFPLRRADGAYRWFLSRAHPVRGSDGTIRSWIGTSLDIHERKVAEERFAALTALAPAIIWFGNPDGSLSYLNDRWYAYTGQTPEEALPMGWEAPVHPDDLPGLLRAWEAARRREVVYDTEARLRRRDGTYRWFQIRAEPLRDAAGAVVGWLGSNSDIHDRRRAEGDLREAREQLQLAVEATGTGIFDYDLLTDTLTWDARTRALFGLPPDAPVSYDTFLAGLHPDDRSWVDAEVQAALDPGGNGSYDIAFRTVGLADGVERWVAAKGRAFAADGRMVRFIGTVRDVTESRRAERALRETEERYRLAARATNDAIWDWNLATNHILWNDALRAAYGHAPTTVEPTGAWWLAHIHPDDRARIDASIHAVIDGTGTAWSDEYRFLRADGSYAAILDRGYVLRDPQGRAVRMIGAMLDISARKRAEEHQRLLTTELQHRIKNTLAMVQAIAAQTFRTTADPDAAREAFSARLISLGRAHDILTRSSWTEAPIAEVVEGALAVHRGGGTPRIRASGPDVRLAAKPALALALALHELATNAAKYGALSTETGSVDLRWHVVHADAAPRFCLTWSEQGGPPILSPPAHRGFGSRLIERSFAAEADGEVKLTYAPTGLVCRFEASLASMREASGEAAA
ncbi:PAS domain-containing protein [Methylobacterium nonmethylotrophicum]|uniref:Blue-light-activated histidine kinase n=1 Tax=Methylobacterium nonmethylotrophicum TaxID=1141884 RepID=A0A4Z0NIR2_9HYPH|nr:PAS domain-containing protein [Methylobacterium nonmethylotrophicum]TGD96165.1 PAS domain S-box protein [Methylobacterium nonmethylotrophicum]